MRLTKKTMAVVLFSIGMAGTAWADVPPVPSGMRAVDAANERDVRLTWSDNSNNETGFVIERQSRAGDGSWGATETITVGANTAMWLDGPGLGTYRYRIAAQNGTETSAFTAWARGGVTGGWTNLSARPDSRVVYVSSTMGNDANSGLSEVSPKKTVEAGYALLRTGYPDQLLLKRGDTWNTSTLMGWQKGGRSATEPMVFGAYGASNERPRIVSTGGSALVVETVDYFAVAGLHFYYDRAHGYDPHTDSGITRDDPGRWFLIEDCLFEHFGKFPMVVQSWRWPDQTLYDVKVRRNVIYHTYDSGLYLSGADGVLVEENIFDTIGLEYSEDHPDNVVAPQCVYVQTTCRNVTANGNIFSNLASSGIQMRPGGEAHNNLFVRGSMGLNFGTTYEGNPPTYGNASRNVILDGKDISPMLPRGNGITLQNMAGGTFTENIVANKTISQSGYAINLGSDARVNNVVFNDTIVYGWRGNLLISDQENSGNEFNRTTVWGSTGNDPVVEHTGSRVTAGMQYRDNRYYTMAPASQWFEVGGTRYSLPGWTAAANDVGSVALSPNDSPWHRSRPPAVASYNAEVLGGAETHDAFMAEARKQSRGDWRQEYTAAAVISYIREGFGLSP